ncbi:MAG: hypothetical protein ACTS6G_03725 [Candidatus Hodgkinia cicadicola]
MRPNVIKRPFRRFINRSKFSETRSFGSLTWRKGYSAEVSWER